LRCAPEQIRAATSEERQLIRAPHAELLGLKDAFETGQITSKQYVDLVPLDYPTEAQEGNPAISPSPPPAEGEAAQSLGDRLAVESGTPETPSQDRPQYPNPTSVFGDDMPTSASSTIDKSPAESSSYGPVRRRVSGKNGPQAYYRPGPMRNEDFAEMMDEIMPQIMERVI